MTFPNHFAGAGSTGPLAGPEPVETDIRTIYHPDPGGGCVVEHVQDATPVVEAIKRGEARAWLSPEREMKATHEIPLVVVGRWAQDHGYTYQQVMNDPILFDRMCFDPDLAAFRIPDND